MNPFSLLLTVIFFCGLTTVTASAECACQCMSGTPRTLCTTLAEARTKPSLCKQRMNCPDFSQGLDTDPALQNYSAPDRNASNCRDSYFWDPDQKNYGILAKVCDVKAPDFSAER